MSIPSTTSVVIIGGGPVGLATSILMSLQKPPIPHLLFERYLVTSIHPKAVGSHARTTEIYRRIGIESTVYEIGAPVSRCRRTAWYTSLGPDGREIVSRDAWGGGKDVEIHEKASPSRFVNCAQIRLEPIFKTRATELNPDGIFFGYEVIDVVESSTSSTVSVKVLNRQTQQTHTVKATYVICCDGGRSHKNESFASKLGMKWEGETDILHMITAHIRAPISKYHPDTRNLITWFINPELRGSINTGFLYHLGPYKPPSRTEESAVNGINGNLPATHNDLNGVYEEWTFACAINPHEPTTFTEQDMRKRMDSVLKIPELQAEKTLQEGGQIDILSLSHWRVNSIVADHYRTPNGRIFLVGDAAHKIPPWGALGMNTGIQDADNLVWKLRLALSHPDQNWDGLLDTYEVERQPAGQRVARISLESMRTHGGVLDRALGILPDNSIEENVRAMNVYFNEQSKEAKQKKAAVQHAMDVLDLEFSALGLEIGCFYPSADIQGIAARNGHAGQIDEKGEFDVTTYHASTLPGHHVAHAWLEKGGVRKSTRDWGRWDGGFVVFTGDERWRVIEGEAIEVVVISEVDDGAEVNGDGDGECWIDVEGMWKENRGISDKGAVMVRPDGIVCWRWDDDEFLTSGKKEDARDMLETEVLAKILKRN